MWKCCVSIARLTRTKQTGGIKRAMRNSPLIILRLFALFFFLFFRPSLPLAPLFSPEEKRRFRFEFEEENEPGLERREG